MPNKGTSKLATPNAVDNLMRATGWIERLATFEEFPPCYPHEHGTTDFWFPPIGNPVYGIIMNKKRKIILKKIRNGTELNFQEIKCLNEWKRKNKIIRNKTERLLDKLDSKEK